ncbi:MAG TPA: amino acid ABC transporter permease [Methanocorpusculum sp.]|nr:amino acid ABC transporter permease [Methanocorpusculum sp.]
MSGEKGPMSAKKKILIIAAVCVVALAGLALFVYLDDINTPDDEMSIKDKFVQNFIEKDRYSYIIEGLCNTLIIAFFALILGMVLGTLVAVIRTVNEMQHRWIVANAVCKVYLTVIRGTPVLVQLLIIYYVIFATVDVAKVIVAIIAFGLNSGAYVAEIIRAGINAVPKGQFEAGSSLGLPFKITMVLIILPQAIKNILPALCNEGITLLKETSVAGYIGTVDLTRAGDIIRSQTYEAFMPLIGVALIYLVMVMVLTWLVGKLERRMKANAV